MSTKLKYISLFSGIGGLDLGLDRAGMECVAQVEFDEYCRRVLTKHWPEVPKYDDVRTVGSHNLPYCDVISGGFPCQDVSDAGKCAGIEGERSGLWSEFHRIICELRPRYVVVENVAGLLVRGIDTVLGDLAGSGYDAEWQVLSASAFGAWHQRNRIFIVATRRWEPVRFADEFPACICCGEPYCERHDTHWFECNCPGPHSDIEDGWEVCEEPWGLVAYPSRIGVEVDGATRQQEPVAPSEPLVFRRDLSGGVSSQWEGEPEMVRVVHGATDWVAGIKALGNTVVPQCSRFVGECIVEFDRKQEG